MVIVSAETSSAERRQGHISTGIDRIKAARSNMSSPTLTFVLHLICQCLLQHELFSMSTTTMPMPI